MNVAANRQKAARDRAAILCWLIQSVFFLGSGTA